MRDISKQYQTPIKPLMIAVSACRKGEGLAAYYHVGTKYVDAVLEAADALPMILPAIGDETKLDGLIEIADGLLLTGSPSNIEPKHYDGGETSGGDISDVARDATILKLIPKAIQAGLPILGLCRGIQEINVALGGTINPRLHATEGRFDHRSDKTLAHKARYEPTHPVALARGGVLAKIMGCSQIQVNSLHGQAIERLAPDLRVEATAEDGTIEAVSLTHSATFCLGVQWHPEWRPLAYPPYMKLFEAFRDACLSYAKRRSAHGDDRRVA